MFEVLDVRFNLTMTSLIVETTAGRFTAKKVSDSSGQAWRVFNVERACIAQVAHPMHAVTAVYDHTHRPDGGMTK